MLYWNINGKRSTIKCHSCDTQLNKAETDIKVLTTVFLIAIVLVLGTTNAHADLGDQLFKLLPSDGAAGDEFGRAIAVDNGVVAVGALEDDDNGPGSGSAYLFDAATGAQLFKLLPSDGAAYDEFGISIAIDYGVVAVGAYYDDDNAIDSGSVYLFDTATGQQIAKLHSHDLAQSEHFGWSVAIDNGIIAVGAAGGIYHGAVYLFDATTYVQLAKLLASDGENGDLFGATISIDNGIVAVDAFNDVINDVFGMGSAYLFDAATGKQLFKLLPSDGAFLDNFGYSIDINNGVVAVGSFGDDDNGDISGSAYLFDASTGVQLFKLLASDGAMNDRFGASIAINNGVVAVGAIYHDDNEWNAGAAYLFDASTGTEVAKLLASDGGEQDRMGIAIAINNGVVAVGAWGDDDNGVDSGSAYLFDATTAKICPWDLDGNGFIGISDLLTVLASWGPCKGCPADFDGNGAVGISDLLALLANWGPCL